MVNTDPTLHQPDNSEQQYYDDHYEYVYPDEYYYVYEDEDVENSAHVSDRSDNDYFSEGQSAVTSEYSESDVELVTGASEVLSELQRFPRQFPVPVGGIPTSQQQQNQFFNPQQFQNIQQPSQQRFTSPGFLSRQQQQQVESNRPQQQQQLNPSIFSFPSGNNGRLEVSSLPQPQNSLSNFPAGQSQSSGTQLGVPPQLQIPSGSGLFDQQTFFNQFQPQSNIQSNQAQTSFQQNPFPQNVNPFTQKSLTPSQSKFQTAFSEVSNIAQNIGNRVNPSLPNRGSSSLQGNVGRVTPSLGNPSSGAHITLFTPTLPPPAGGQTRPDTQSTKDLLTFFSATPPPPPGVQQSQGPASRQNQFR